MPSFKIELGMTLFVSQEAVTLFCYFWTERSTGDSVTKM